MPWSVIRPGPTLLIRELGWDPETSPKTLNANGVVLFSPSSKSETFESTKSVWRADNLPKLQESTVYVLIAPTVAAALCILPFCTDHSFFPGAIFLGLGQDLRFPRASFAYCQSSPKYTRYLFERARIIEFRYFPCILLCSKLLCYFLWL